MYNNKRQVLGDIARYDADETSYLECYGTEGIHVHWSWHSVEEATNFSIITCDSKQFCLDKFMNRTKCEFGKNDRIKTIVVNWYYLILVDVNG